MTVHVLGSVKGAPGVTTTALALAAVRPRPGLLLVELDPDGGVIAARRGLGFDPGLVTLATALRRGSAHLAQHAQPLGRGAAAVVAPSSARHTAAALAAAAPQVWRSLDDHDGVVIADCGRLTRDAAVAPLLARAARVLVFARPRLDDVALLHDRLPELRGAGAHPELVLRGRGPYEHREIAAELGAPVAAVLPDDRRTATALDDGAKVAGRRRAPLLRAAAVLAGTLLSEVVPLEGARS